MCPGGWLGVACPWPPLLKFAEENSANLGLANSGKVWQIWQVCLTLANLLFLPKFTRVWRMTTTGELECSGGGNAVVLGVSADI